MNCNWISASLGDHLDFKNGKTSPERAGNASFEVYGSNGVIGFSEETNSLENCLIVGRVGSYCGSVYHSDNKCWITDNAIMGMPKELNESEFWYFLLLKLDLNSYRSGSGQPLLNQATLKSIPIKIPELSEVRAEIGKQLMMFDNKIELNRQTNQTLENIAQAMFKSWFIDFEPVKAKVIIREKGGDDFAQSLAAQAIIAGTVTLKQLESMESRPSGWEDVLHPLAVKNFEPMGLDYWMPEQLESLAKLFPNTLVESELGEIPEEWAVRAFGDVSKCFDSKRIPLSKKKREEKKPGHIPYYGATSIMDYVNEWIFDDIYLLLGEDGSVVKEDGAPFIQYIWGKTWVNNHAHVLQGKNGVSTEQLMLFIQGQNIAAYITGAVQLKLNQGNMNSIPFLDGGEDLNVAFYDFISPIYESIRNTVEENCSLTEIRDILLSKLLSGELSLDSNQVTMEVEQ